MHVHIWPNLANQLHSVDMLLIWADHEWPENAGFCARLKPDLELYQNVVSGSKQNDSEIWQENQSDFTELKSQVGGCPVVRFFPSSVLEVAVRIKIG